MGATEPQEWLDALCNAQKGVAEGIVARHETLAPVILARWTRSSHSVLEPLRRSMQSATRTHQAVVDTVQHPDAAYPGAARIVALPLMRDKAVSGAVALCFTELSPDAASGVIDALRESGAALMLEPGALRVEGSIAQADVVLQIQAAVLSQSRFDEAAAFFATRLAELLAFDRVSVGIVDKGYARVVAFSHGAALDAQQAVSRGIAAAMDEAIDQAATIALPAMAGPPRITLAHAELRRGSNGSGAVYTIPIVNLGAIAGAVTLQRATGQPMTAAELVRCEHIVNLAGPVLALKSENDVSAITRMRRACTRQWQRLTNPGERPFKLAVAGVALLLIFVLAVPVPYSISAPTRLEGSVQRALVAASDGFIQQVSARPGDAVKAGQVLAELAQHDLQLERSKRESELAQYTNAYGAAFARADRSLLMVNQAKMAEARAQLELAETQIERAQVKAPFDGIVISGDLTQQLGAPVQRGAVLMVVAPAEGYRLIVEVDERDINDVKAGAAGRVALAAMPGATFAFRIDRVTPLAATREGRHFFEVEGKLDTAGTALRPGLQGVARIGAASRPLAAMALGRVLNWLRLKLWAWGWWGWWK